MNEPVFCPACDAECSPRVETREETIRVRGEPQQAMAQVSVCPTCGQDLVHAPRDDRALASAYNAYRQRHGLLLPDDIRQLRERYGLSQRTMALLLGLDPGAVPRYEAGALQNAAHDDLLRRFADPMIARTMALPHRDQVSPRQWARFEQATARPCRTEP